MDVLRRGKTITFQSISNQNTASLSYNKTTEVLYHDWTDISYY